MKFSYAHIEEIFNIFMAILSLIFVTKSYFLLSHSATDLDRVMLNLQTLPVVSIKSVNADENCPEGSQPIPLINWPGAQSRGCACPYGAMFKLKWYYSTITSCSINQTRAGWIFQILSFKKITKLSSRLPYWLWNWVHSNAILERLKALRLSGWWASGCISTAQVCKTRSGDEKEWC